MSAGSTTETAAGRVSEPGRSGESRAGLVYGVAAYTMWGIFPLYFWALAKVPPWVVLCHRILGSSVLLGVVVSVRGEWPAIWPVLRPRRNVLLLSAGAVLIALNWLLFIYAIGSGQTLQASLGYFINPLLSIALGMFFLRERLRRWQWLAVLLALAGLTNQAVRGAGVPWLALSLALTFGFYGLVRKKVDTHSLHGLLVETTLLLPLSLIVLWRVPAGPFTPGIWGLLSLAGLITTVPLLCFGAAVRRLRLATIGFLQYIGPTLQFLVAVCVFHEPLDHTKLGSFALCWLAIGVYVADSVLARMPQPVADEPE